MATACSSARRVRAQFAYSPPDALTLAHLYRARRLLEMAIDMTDHGQMGNARRGREVRRLVTELDSHVRAAWQRLEAVQPDSYIMYLLRRLLREGRAAVGSAHGNFGVARRNYPWMREKLDRVIARMRREAV